VTNIQSSNGRLPLLWALGAFVLAAKDLVPTSPAPLPAGEFATYYIVNHPSFRIGFPALFCLFGAVYFALGNWSAVRVRPILGYAHFAVMLIGAAVIQAPMTAARLAGPTLFEDPVATIAIWSHLGPIGYAVSLAGLLLFAYVLLDAWLQAKVGTGG
jgi:cytochrome c oxidase subunit 1